MIQRIQSVYLFLALLLTGSLFFINMANLVSLESDYSLTHSGIVSLTSEGAVTVMPALALNILLWITSITLLVTIFLFKKRIVQIRLAGLTLGLLVGLSGLMFYFGKSGAREFAAQVNFTYAIVLPLIALVFVIMAIRAIGKDEALVKSLDRLRP